MTINDLSTGYALVKHVYNTTKNSFKASDKLRKLIAEAAEVDLDNIDLSWMQDEKILKMDGRDERKANCIGYAKGPV